MAYDDGERERELIHGHVLGYVTDADGFALNVGTYQGTVTVGDQFPYRLDPRQAEDFARLFVSACWEAAAQRSTDMTDAQRAELAAAAEEMRLADCGGTAHDKACTPLPEGTVTA